MQFLYTFLRQLLMLFCKLSKIIPFCRIEKIHEVEQLSNVVVQRCLEGFSLREVETNEHTYPCENYTVDGIQLSQLLENQARVAFDWQEWKKVNKKYSQETRYLRRWPSSTTKTSQREIFLNTAPNSVLELMVSKVVTKTWNLAPVVSRAIFLCQSS